MLITNALSLNMFDLSQGYTIEVCPLEVEHVKRLLGESLESAIGYENTAAVVSSLVGLEVPANRQTVRLEAGDELIVAQYTGPRLAAGATTLPDNARIDFVYVEVN